SDIFERLVERAKREFDGHLTVCRFTTNWRVGFFTPESREDIDRLTAGKTFEEAAAAALALSKEEHIRLMLGDDVYERYITRQIQPQKFLLWKHSTDGLDCTAHICADGAPVALHRTFLARDGGSKAPEQPSKMMLGPCRGGAVRLGEARDALMVGEGIETCLAAQQATGHPTWAALSTSGLRALDLSRAVRNVIVLADGDDPGEAAAQECAWRWKRKGRRVRIARPPRG